MNVTIPPVLRRFPAPVALLLVALAVTGCGNREAHEASVAPPVDVRVTMVRSVSIADQYEAGGVVQARESATLVSRIMAPVQQIRVKPGDRVGAGQVLVVLDARDIAANARRSTSAVVGAEQGARAAAAEREAAEAALALAKSTHDRIVRLSDRKSATPQELDEATASLRGAQARATGAAARVAEADAALATAKASADASTVVASYGVITAPFAGVVTEKLTDIGNMASPGTPLLRLDATGSPRVDVRIDESRAQWLQPGQPVAVAFETSRGTERTTGTLSEIAQAIDAGSRAFLVKVTLPESSDVRSGTFARVSFGGASRAALVVPRDALVARGQLNTVFVVEKDVAHLRLVQAGAISAQGVEMLAGLDPGEHVVLTPPPGLVDGRRVRATQVSSSGTEPTAAKGGAR